ncbi:uncharacterized protein ACIBXB_008529 [Morphnus guianensis]
MSDHNSSAVFALDTWNRKEQHSSSAMCNIPKKHHGNISVLLPSWSAIRSLQRFDRGAVICETILLQQALQKLQKWQPYIQQSGRRLKGQREGSHVQVAKLLRRATEEQMLWCRVLPCPSWVIEDKSTSSGIK